MRPSQRPHKPRRAPTKIQRDQLSRKKFLKLGAAYGVAAAVALLLAACGGGDGEGGEDTGGGGGGGY